MIILRIIPLLAILQLFLFGQEKFTDLNRPIGSILKRGRMLASQLGFILREMAFDFAGSLSGHVSQRSIRVYFDLVLQYNVFQREIFF